MSSAAPYDAIVFDLLDTLYPWGPDRYSKALDALCETVAAATPHATADEVRERYVDIRTRYSATNLSELVENDFHAFVLELAESLGATDCEQLAQKGIRAYDSAFAGALELPAGVFDMLHGLSSRFKLGVLSNYPTSGGIRAALQRDGLAAMLDAVVVSAEVGYIKPHPAMFRTLCERLGCSSERALLVGDTYESDVVGAWLAGMPCVRVTPSASGIEQGQFFNGHIRKWLESRTDLQWRNARPVVELENVIQLEGWLGRFDRPLTPS